MTNNSNGEKQIKKFEAFYSSNKDITKIWNCNLKTEKFVRKTRDSKQKGYCVISVFCIFFYAFFSERA